MLDDLDQYKHRRLRKVNMGWRDDLRDKGAYY